MFKYLLALVPMLLFSTISYAAPPPGVDLNGPVAKWFESLKQPGTGVGCCSTSDCRPVDADQGGKDGHFEAKIEDHWVDIPPSKVLLVNNPIGKSVACYVPIRNYGKNGEDTYNILCFVPGTMI